MEFDDFLQAVTDRPAPREDESRVAFERVTVLGGNTDARLLAALCLANGASVRLFSAYASELEAVQSGIAINGNGPVGRYHVTAETATAAHVHSTASASVSSSQNHAIVTTGSLDSCLENAQLIFLTGPIHKQRTYAMVLADHLQDGQVLVVPNARTFGALEVSWLLKAGGCTADITIAEMQGLPYFVNAEGTALELQPVTSAAVSCIPAKHTRSIVNALSPLLPNLTACASVLHSSFADCSAVAELPALIIGGPALSVGGSSIPMGATSLPENESFLNLLGAQQRSVSQLLYDERVAVARRFGIRDLPDFSTALTIAAGAEKGDGRRYVPSQQTALTTIRDAVTGSLSPLLDAAAKAGVATPVTQSMVTLASGILGADISASGRRLLNLGITDSTFDDTYARLSHGAKHGTKHGPGSASSSHAAAEGSS